MLPMPSEIDKLTPSSAATSPSGSDAESGHQLSLMSGRDESLDIAKGIGILLVVVGHVFDGLIASAYFPPAVLWPTLVVFTIYLFHMPLFLVVSGHLASGKHRPAGTTIARLLPTVVYPYFLWSLAQGMVMIYLTKYTTSHVPLSSLYKILWIPIVPYWFLYALFFCHLGYLGVRKLPYGVQLAIAAVVFVVPQFFLPGIGSARLSIVPETTRGFLYFVVGVVSVSQVKRFGRTTALAATVLFALLAAVYYHFPGQGAAVAIGAVPAGIAGIVATLAWSRVLAERRGWLVRTLSFWGRYSMSIYVLHIFFTAGARMALKHVATRLARHGAGSALAAAVLEVAVATMLGILLPLGINWVVSKFDMDKWLGLQHMETS
jgi:fucose 4-O-acetylase-like acetyltransferase